MIDWIFPFLRHLVDMKNYQLHENLIKPRTTQIKIQNWTRRLKKKGVTNQSETNRGIEYKYTLWSPWSSEKLLPILYTSSIVGVFSGNHVTFHSPWLSKKARSCISVNSDYRTKYKPERIRREATGRTRFNRDHFVYPFCRADFIF